MKLKQLKSTRGMTLIEIILVLVLLGSVMAIVGGKVFNTFKKGQVGAAKLQMQKIGAWLDLYQLDCFQYPQSLDELLPGSGGGSCQSFDPDGYTEGKSSIPKDPWGVDYQYKSDGRTYEIISLGADKAEGGEGKDADISSKDE